MTPEALNGFNEFEQKANRSTIPKECYELLQYLTFGLKDLSMTAEGIVYMAATTFGKRFDTFPEAQYAILYASSVSTAKQNDHITPERQQIAAEYYGYLSKFRMKIDKGQAANTELYLEGYFKNKQNRDTFLVYYLTQKAKFSP